MPNGRVTENVCSRGRVAAALDWVESRSARCHTDAVDSYRSSTRDLERRVRDLEAELHEMTEHRDLLRAENERLRRDRRDRKGMNAAQRAVKARQDRLARIFGSGALVIGFAFLIGGFFLRDEGPFEGLFCLLTIGSLLSGTGIWQLAVGRGDRSFA